MSCSRGKVDLRWKSHRSSWGRHFSLLDLSIHGLLHPLSLTHTCTETEFPCKSGTGLDWMDALEMEDGLQRE